MNSDIPKIRMVIKKTRPSKKKLNEYVFNFSSPVKHHIDEFFENTIKILKKSSGYRSQNDIQNVIHYFPFLPALNKMILKVNGDKSYDILYKIAKHLDYMYYPKNELVMRIGDIGKNFFIILKGSVDVLVLKMKNKNMLISEYYRYLALLIGYNEIEILNKVINDNFDVYPMEIEDDVEFGKITKTILKYEKKTIKKLKIDTLFSFFENEEKEKIISFGIVTYDKNGKVVYNFQSEQQKEDNNYKVILNKINSSMKMIHSSSSINNSKIINENKNKSFFLEKEINKEEEEKKEEMLTSELYIKRLQTYKLNENSEILNKKSDISFIRINVNIYEYVNLQSFNTGQYFGDFPSNDPIDKRKVSIITNSECHFGILKKRNYIDILKESVEKNKKGYMIYIISTFIFKNCSVRLIQNRFFQNFVILNSKKGDFLIEQMQKNDKIILIKHGCYEIGLKTSLKEIPEIIRYFYKKIKLTENEERDLKILSNTKYNNNKIIEEFHSNESIYILQTIELLSKKVKQMLKEDKKIRNSCKELKIIKQLYNTKFDTVLTIINSYNIFGFDDMEYENGLNLFYIKCTNDGEYLTLDKEIYPILCKTEETVKENEIKFVRLELSKIISRLLEIRKIKFSTFLEMNPTYKSIIDNKESNDLINFFEQKRIEKIYSTRRMSSKNTKTNFVKINPLSLSKKTGKKKIILKNNNRLLKNNSQKDIIPNVNISKTLPSPKKNNSFSQTQISIYSQKFINVKLPMEKKEKKVMLNKNTFRNKLLKQSISSNHLFNSIEKKYSFNSKDSFSKNLGLSRNELSETQRTRSYIDIQMNNSSDLEKFRKQYLINITPLIKKININKINSSQKENSLIDIYDKRLTKRILYIEKRNKYNIKSTRDFFMRYKDKLDFKKVIK